jgi:hypothetical protein
MPPSASGSAKTASDPSKRDLFARLADHHHRTLAAVVERAIFDQLQDGSSEKGR